MLKSIKFNESDCSVQSNNFFFVSLIEISRREAVIRCNSLTKRVENCFGRSNVIIIIIFFFVTRSDRSTERRTNFIVGALVNWQKIPKFVYHRC